ncbi:para-aminobenzoate N-oxygenase AurF [Pseudomonas sp. WPR_5_2]|uniref:diiron oxygenase n=1 Tax=Pseudomonas sp. WPR_5_2 TaxID=1907371 RepID=UPI000EB413A3|nr:diiron oxygenase [Pseudomonas sp. WPR_5_2]RKS28198.1 para-aminobenzoate N-oxygenase AurF [Pseudomonas sp. WPR_5_2]
MNTVANIPGPDSGNAARYAQMVRSSKKAEWQIDRDLLQDRHFDFSRKFLPDGLSRVDRLTFLAADEARLLSQIQGRTYAYIFGLVERFISAKMLDQGRAHVFDDQLALEALVRFSNDEIKHQELFRRMETMMSAQLPAGYRQVADPNDVARAVLAASSWSVLALTCHIELFVQSHYTQSIAPHEELCPLFKDVFKFHWKDESRHVVLDELEWKAEHAKLSPAEHDQAVDDLIALVAAVDAILQAQSAADTDYFIRNVSPSFGVDETAQIKACVLGAYRWQYIISGVQHPHFGRLLTRMTTPAQMSRIQTALAPIMGH